MWSQLRIATLMLVVMTVLTGVVYPLVVTGVAQLVFPHRADGSLVARDGEVVGSELIGQTFSGAAVLLVAAVARLPTTAARRRARTWGRPTRRCTSASRRRSTTLRAAHGEAEPIPVDLATASGSGLDPHISPPRRSIRWSASPRRAACPSRRCAAWSRSTSRDGSSASSASRESTCCCSTSRSTSSDPGASERGGGCGPPTRQRPDPRSRDRWS